MHCSVAWCTEDHSLSDEWYENLDDQHSRLHRRTWPSGINLLLLEPDDDNEGPRVTLPPDRNDETLYTLEQVTKLAAELTESAFMAQAKISLQRDVPIAALTSTLARPLREVGAAR